MSVAAPYHFTTFSSLVPQRHGAAQKPPILSVGAADAHLLLERLTTGKACAHSSYNSIPIFGMNRICPDSLCFAQLRLAGIFNPASVPKLNGPIGSRIIAIAGMVSMASRSFLPHAAIVVLRS